MGTQGPNLLVPKTSGVGPMPLPELVLPKLYAAGPMSRCPILPNLQSPNNLPTGMWNSVRVWKTLSFRELAIIERTFIEHVLCQELAQCFVRSVLVRVL